MHAQNLVVNEGSNGHAVEHVLELLPDADAVSALALVVEAIHAIDLPALVVSSQQEEVLTVLHFVSEEQDDGLEGLSTTVNVVTEEEVVGLWWETSILKESQQVWELSVSVTYKELVRQLAVPMADGLMFKL